MLWAILFIPVLLGLGLLALGLRGRAIDDHPVCRRCRFDLVGTHPKGQKCPECGSEHAGAGAVRIGNRRRRGRVLAGGVGVLVLSIAIGGVLGWANATSFDWNTVKPARLLAQEMQSADRATAEPAIRELRRRISEAKLSDRNASRLADIVLAMQGDLDARWHPEAGRLIKELRERGQVDDERFRIYAEQAWPMRVEFRRQVVQGEPLPFRLILENRSGGNNTIITEGALLRLVIDNESIDGGQHGRFTYFAAAGFPQAPAFDGHVKAFLPVDPARSAPEDWLDVQWPPGRYTAKAAWAVAWGMPAAEVRIPALINRRLGPPPSPLEPGTSDPLALLRSHMAGRIAGVSTRTRSDDPALPVTRIVELTGEIEVLPPGSETVELVTFGGRGRSARVMPAAVKQAVRIDVGPTPEFVQEAPPVQVDVQIPSDAPIEMAFDIYWRCNDTEMHLGSIVSERNPVQRLRSTHQSRLPEPPGGYPETITIILRPSTAVARRTATITRIWGEELIFERPTPRAPPLDD